MSSFISEFKNGDLIYGTSEGRISYINRLKMSREDLSSVIVDEINYKALNKYTGEYSELKNIDDKQAKEHFGFLEKHEKYTPKSVPGFLEQMVKEIKPEDMIDTRGIRIKRACKGGILRIIDTQENRIHFILKGFDYKNAFSKEGESGKDGVIKYTNSEFRLIYRLWRSSPDKVDKKVVFWDDKGNKILPTDYFNSIKKDINYTPKNEESVNRLRDFANKEKTKQKDRDI